MLLAKVGQHESPACRSPARRLVYVGDPAGPQPRAAAVDVRGGAIGPEMSAFDFFVAKGLSKDPGRRHRRQPRSGVERDPDSRCSRRRSRSRHRAVVGRRPLGHRHDDNVLWYASTHGASVVARHPARLHLVRADDSRLRLARSTAATTSPPRRSRSRPISRAAASATSRTASRTPTKSWPSGTAAAVGRSGGSGSGGKSVATRDARQGDARERVRESKFDDLWYQCNDGSWVDRWTDPTPCSGVTRSDIRCRA